MKQKTANKQTNLEKSSNDQKARVISENKHGGGLDCLQPILDYKSIYLL